MEAWTAWATCPRIVHPSDAAIDRLLSALEGSPETDGAITASQGHQGGFAVIFHLVRPTRAPGQASPRIVAEEVFREAMAVAGISGSDDCAITKLYRRIGPPPRRRA